MKEGRKGKKEGKKGGMNKEKRDHWDKGGNLRVGRERRWKKRWDEK